MADTFTPEQISQILEEFFKVVGTRQYIGARYVPIFGRKGEDSIEWDNSAPYEPLTIVLYQGNSYTSRQFVPVGVEITNQEFWAITGNYNAQVEVYRRLVENYKNDVDVLKNSLTSGFVDPTPFDNIEGFFTAIDNGSIGVLAHGDFDVNGLHFYDKSQIKAVNGSTHNGSIVLSDSDNVTSNADVYGHLAIDNETQIIAKGYALSAASMDTLRNRVVACFSGESDTGGFVLAALNDNNGVFTVDDEKLISGLSTHCNSITYNQKTDCFYIPARPTPNVIYEFNAGSLTFSKEITIEFADIIRSFAYDIDNDIYYAIGNSFVKIFDNNFGYVKTLDITYANVASALSDYTTYHQDSCVVKGNLVQLVALTPNDENTFTDYALVQYHNNDEISINTYKNEYVTQEAECIFVKDDYVYVMESRGRYCSVVRISIKPLSAKNTNRKEMVLRAGTDINTLVDNGTYLCSADIIPTLLNVPFGITSAFTLEVFQYYTGNYAYQLFITYTGALYIRRFNYSTGAWFELGAPLFHGKVGALGNSFYGWEDTNNNQFHGFATIGIGTIQNWNQVGSMYVSDDLTFPIPDYGGTEITHYAISATAGASTAFVFPCSFRISENTVSYRLLSPIQYTTQAISMRVHLDFTYR